MATRPSPEKKIIAAEKGLDMSLQEVIDKLSADGEMRQIVLTLPRMRGQLRLNIHARSANPQSWSMSVVLYSHRVDARIGCIDWEGSFADMEGNRMSGFHQHIWDDTARSCDLPKLSLPTFSPTSIREFLNAGFEMMNIKLRREEADGQMQINT